MRKITVRIATTNRKSHMKSCVIGLLMNVVNADASISSPIFYFAVITRDMVIYIP